MKKLLAMLLALVLAVSMFAVAVFADTTEQQGDDEGDETNVGDTEAPAEEENPKTGIALAALPIVVSAAAAVVSKKH